MKAFKKPKVDARLRLTDEVMKKICNSLRAGAYIETACALAGVSKVSLYAWLKKGNDKPNSIYGEFLNAVDKAQAEAEMRDLINIDNSAMGRKYEYERDANGKLVMNQNGDPILITQGQQASWQASAWRLERKHPKKWGRLDRIETSGSNIAPQVVLMMPDNGRSSDSDE